MQKNQKKQLQIKDHRFLEGKEKGEKALGKYGNKKGDARGEGRKKEGWNSGKIPEEGGKTQETGRESKAGKKEWAAKKENRYVGQKNEKQWKKQKERYGNDKKPRQAILETDVNKQKFKKDFKKEKLPDQGRKLSSDSEYPKKNITIQRLETAERKTNVSETSSKNSACPSMKQCGGCCYQDISYQEELKIKQMQGTQILGDFGKLEPMIGMENPRHYRNKVHAVFARKKDGSIISGVYQEGTHKVIPVEKCLIENEKADAIIGTIRELVKSFKIKIYDEDSEYGLLRHVLVRVGHRSGEIMVVLVLSSPILPSKNNFLKALRSVHPEITTVVINVNDKKTSMVLGDKEQVIYGKGYIEDTLCGCVFRISPKSFYQVNSVQTEKLYEKALEFAGLTGKETVLDAYCGIGTIGIAAANQAKEIIGVELNPDAVRDAIMNAKRNKIKNISFYRNDAGIFMTELANQHTKVDVVLMDPPRTGSDEAFLSSVIKLLPERIVYISCNPLTLKRDLNYLVKDKYRVERMVLVDMFAGTKHVETVVKMSRK